MKPESVQCLLNCYLREKQFSSCYDDVDGTIEKESSLTGGAYGSYENETTDNVIPEGAASLPNSYLGALAPEEIILARRIGRQLSELSDDFERRHLAENQAIAIGNRVVEFRERCLFVSPNCGNIEIPVVRRGTPQGVAKVSWRTRNRSAKSGVHYTSSRGDISFAEGETEKSVQVEVIRNQQRDVCFTVELLRPEGTDIGHPMTVYVADHTGLYDDEKRVVENIINCGPNASVSFVSECVGDCMTANTFRAGLQYLCSQAESVPDELASAFELCRLACRRLHAPTSALCNVMANFFSHLPELEDIGQYFDDFN